MIRALQRLGLADIYGETDVPLYVLNAVYPLIDDEFLGFCEGKDAVLVVEEGQPNYIEQAFAAMLHKAGARHAGSSARSICRWPANIPAR